MNLTLFKGFPESNKLREDHFSAIIGDAFIS